MKRNVGTMSAVLTVALSLMAAPGHAQTREVDVTKPATATGVVEIDNLAGEVFVTGWDRNEIHIRGRLGEDVEELIFEVDGDESEIEVKVPRNSGKRNMKVASNLEIRVPARSSLEIRVVSADVAVNGVTGEAIDAQSVSGTVAVTDAVGVVDVSSISGRIEVNGTTPAVEVESTSGAVKVTGRHEHVEAHTISGRIEIDGVQRTVDVESISGKAVINGGTLSSVETSSLSGGLEFTGALTPDGQFDAESHSGHMRVNFTQPVHGRYEIEAFSGRINVPFGPEPQRKSKHGPGTELKFDHGEGGAEVSISLFSGSVTIEQP